MGGTGEKLEWKIYMNIIILVKIHMGGGNAI